jgi:LacI family transcriptional regulator
VEQPIDEMGRVAAELLFERMFESKTTRETAPTNGAHKVELKTRFIPRRSCGCSGVNCFDAIDGAPALRVVEYC